MIIKSEYLKKYNMETLEEAREMFGDTKDTEIEYYKTFLKQSDYIIAKILEAYIHGATIEELEYKYSDLLSIRQQARDRINELAKEAETNE